MSDRDDEPGPPRVLCEVGGDVDEASANLGVYAEDLDPDLVTAELGCAPTRSFRKGDPPPRPRPGSRPMRHGAWLLKVRGYAPLVPDELLRRLFALVPSDPEIWSRLRERYRVRLGIGVHTGGWNRGFELSADVLRMVNVIGAGLGFDLYFYGDDTDGLPT